LKEGKDLWRQVLLLRKAAEEEDEETAADRWHCRSQPDAQAATSFTVHKR